MQRKPRNLAPPADREAVLFSRLVERVLSWPCPECGKSGLCECYRPKAAQPGTSERKESGQTNEKAPRWQYGAGMVESTTSPRMERAVRRGS
jgi:hypothetical protein